MLSRLRSFVRGLITAPSGMAATAQTFVANILIVGVNLCTGILSARLLGAEGRGELAAMSMWPQLLAFLLTLGLPSALLYNLRCAPERGNQLFSSFLLLGLAMSLVTVSVGVVIIPFWLTQYSGSVVHFAQVGMITAPVALFTVVFTNVLTARNEFGLFNLVRLGQPLTCLVIMAGLALADVFDPYSAAIATLVAGIPWCLWMFMRFWRLYAPRLSGLEWASGRLLSYGIRSYGVDLLRSLSEQMDRIIVVGLLDSSLMGLYVVAVNIALTTNLMSNAVVSVLFSKSSGRPAEEVIIVTGRAVRAALVLSVVVAVIGIVITPVVLGLLYGGDFVAATSLTRILLLESVLRGTVFILAHAFMGLGRPGLVGALQGAGLALAVPLMLLLAPRYGLEGVGYALLISTLARLALIQACFPMILGLRAPRLWPGRQDLTELLGRIRSLPR